MDSGEQRMKTKSIIEFALGEKLYAAVFASAINKIKNIDKYYMVYVFDNVTSKLTSEVLAEKFNTCTERFSLIFSSKIQSTDNFVDLANVYIEHWQEQWKIFSSRHIGPRKDALRKMIGSVTPPSGKGAKWNGKSIGRAIYKKSKR